MHPFILHKSINDIYIGIFILNSNAQELSIKYINQNNNESNCEKNKFQTKLNFITIGGILDIYIMKGQTPLKVIQQYHNLIGRPQLPPLWGLGWHHSRWGYSSIDSLNAVSQLYTYNKLPLDGNTHIIYILL